MAHHFCRMLVACVAVLVALPVKEIASAQTPKTQRLKVQPSPKGSFLYENEEIKVRIPRGWRVLPKRDDAEGTLRLQKGGYTLSLGYHTGQASGIIGGRFIEIFDIPWLSADDAWTCSLSLTQDPWPASHRLMFVNLIVDAGDSNVREHCGIPKPSGVSVENRRWLGGYFTTRVGFYFFAGGDDNCGSKAYTLVSQATAPEQLPFAATPQNDNPELLKTIEETIQVVDSIRYKRCSPF